MLGCTEPQIQSPPYSECQWYSKNTDLNCTQAKAGDYNNMVALWHGNKVSAASASDLNVALPDLSPYVKYSGGNQDLNLFDFNVSAKYFLGDGSQLTNLPITPQVYCDDGNSFIGSTCTPVYSKSQLDNWISNSYDVEVYEDDFFNGLNVKTTVGTWSTANTRFSSYFLRTANNAVVGTDAYVVFAGTGAGTGTTTNATTINPQRLIDFHYIGYLQQSTVKPLLAIGYTQTTSANNLKTLHNGLGFIYDGNNPDDLNIYGYSQLEGQRTTTSFAYPVTATNMPVELKIETNNPRTREGRATEFYYYAKNPNTPTWTYLGMIDGNIPYENLSQTKICSNLGIWYEVQNALSSLPAVYVDYVRVRMTRKDDGY